MKQIFFIIIALLCPYATHSQSQKEKTELAEDNIYNVGETKLEFLLREDLIQYVEYYEPDGVEISQAILSEVYRSRAILMEGIYLIKDRKYESAINTLLVAKTKLEFLLQPVYLNQANLYLAFAFYQLNDFDTTYLYLKQIDYAHNIPNASIMAGDLYYSIGYSKRAIKVYKSIIKGEPRNLEAHAKLYAFYKFDQKSVIKAEKYEARYNQILRDKKNNEVPADELDIEINELKQVH